MSVKIMQKAWEISCETHTLKLVLIALADNASDEGVCWPSMRTIAAKCDLSEQSCRDQVNKLKEAGLVKVRHRTNASNLYFVLCDDPKAALSNSYKRQTTTQHDCPPHADAPTPLPAPSMPDAQAPHAVGPNRKESSKRPKGRKAINLEELNAIYENLPATHKSDQAKAAWELWVKTRIEYAPVKNWKGKFEMEAEFVASQPPGHTVEILKTASRANWRSLFPLKENNRGGRPAPLTRPELDSSRFSRKQF